ncbi:Receptor-like protein kinase FERONIA [Acorus gramineus]|uniref:Receptor-like protein kinase FERONIA n=1 Tax=Acorus gramineus TaxID=55184 RepID=A0AAV9B7V5_ACOGR|nr:Receptor-like protein kinase FERONIA [Acorus gramineus]
MKTHRSIPNWLSLLLVAVITAFIEPTFAQNSTATTAYVPVEMIFLNCGAPKGNQSQDGLSWEGDFGSRYALGIQKTVSATPSDQAFGVPTVPYMTARIFQTPYTYSFPVTPGRKFVRLHFYPSNFTDPKFVTPDSFFSVSVGPYTLLNNFSALLTAQAMSYNYIIKEFSVNISSSTLNLTFTPSPANKKAFAFVNGIEIVSMPQFFGGSDTFTQPQIVGTMTTLPIDEYTAFETVARLNVGGSTVSPVDDSGLYREWDDDSIYIYGAAVGRLGVLSGMGRRIDIHLGGAVGVTYPKDPNVTIKYSDTLPEYIAPPVVYGTARLMGQNASVNLNYNLTWIITVDAGFSYFVRLHFCEITYLITEINMRVFDIFINNMTAKEAFDVMAYTNHSGLGVPIYLDFIVFFPNTSASSQQDIWVSLHPDIYTKPTYYDAELNGLEIFKINDSSGNLAGPIFLSEQQRAEPSKKKQVQHFLAIKIGVPGVVLLISLLAFMGWKRWRQQKVIQQSYGSSLPLPSNRGHLFSFSEIKTATKDFSNSLVIGVGGFGKKLTEKSDVYSFGIVLFEVLCGRPALDHSLPEEQVSLSNWALHCKQNAMIDQIIDPNLKNDISPDSLEKFVEIAEKCLAYLGIGRPSMGDVLWNLEVALQMHSGFEMGESSFDPTSISRYEGMTSSIVVNGDSVFSDLRSPKGR